MMSDMSIAEALAKAEHLKALGQTEIYLYRDQPDFPYDKVTQVKSGSSYRLSGPSSCALYAEIDGITFRMSVDFEGVDANGRGVSLFDRDRLRELMMKLPDAARKSFADMLRAEVLPGMAKRSAEIRDGLRSQLDSEDCVRGLIAFATGEQAHHEATAAVAAKARRRAA